MIRKNAITIVIFLLFHSSISAQQNIPIKPWDWIYDTSIDSLETFLARQPFDKKDTTFIAIREYLCYYYLGTADMEKVILHAKKEKEYAAAMNYDIYKLRAEVRLNIAKGADGNFIEGLESSRNYLRFLQSRPYPDDQRFLGGVNRVSEIASMYENIGTVFLMMQQNDSALYYYKKSESTIPNNNVGNNQFLHMENAISMKMTYAYMNMQTAPQKSVALLLERKQMLDSFVSNLQTKNGRLTFSEQHFFNSRQITTFSILAMVYTVLKDYNALEKVMNEAEKLVAENPTPTLTQKRVIADFKGQFNFLKKNYPAAITYYTEALRLADSLHAYQHIASSAQHLNQIYNLIGDVANANKYAMRMKTAQDVIKSKLIVRALNADLYKRDKELLDKNLKVEKTKSYAILALAALLAIILWLMIRRKKLNDLLNQKRIKEVELRHALREMELKFETEMRERKRIAQELHDSLGASLTGTKLAAESMASGNEATHALVGMLSSVHEEMRAITHDLMPPDFEQHPFSKLLKDLTASLSRHSRQNITCIIERDAENISLSQVLKKTLFRISQELLSNSIKYAKAKNIETMLCLQADGALLLSVEDDGVGFDRTQQHEGIGLKNCRQRCEEIDAQFTINSQPGKGTVAQIVLPQRNE